MSISYLIVEWCTVYVLTETFYFQSLSLFVHLQNLILITDSLHDFHLFCSRIKNTTNPDLTVVFLCDSSGCPPAVMAWTISSCSPGRTAELKYEEEWSNHPHMLNMSEWWVCVCLFQQMRIFYFIGVRARVWVRLEKRIENEWKSI